MNKDGFTLIWLLHLLAWLRIGLGIGHVSFLNGVFRILGHPIQTKGNILVNG